MIGLIFGETNFPIEVLKKIKTRKLKYLIIDLSKSKKFKKDKKSYSVTIGQFGKIINILKQNNCKKVLFAGKVSKPNFSKLKLDLKGIYYIPRIIKASKLGDVAILKEIDVQHPAAKMLVEIAKSTDNEVGDGTTSAVVLAGALLEQAESLLLQEVHPTVIVDGYRKAANKAKEYIKDIADQVAADNKSTLLKIAKTSMQTKLVRKNSDQLADMVVQSVLAVAEKNDSNYTVDIDDIKVEKKSGGSISESTILQGIVLD